MKRRPALQKRKMLPYVKVMLIKHDFMEAIIGKLVRIFTDLVHYNRDKL